jgi:uncharacterized membrane protein
VAVSEPNVNARLETFCDGVFAIALTLLIIDIKVPATATSTAGLWRDLGALLPSIFAFLLSFVAILITWANHHAMMRLVDKSSQAFILANGLLLLSVVFFPFPTSLLGSYVLTDHAAPAVVLYSSVGAFQVIGWLCVSHAALGPRPLTRDHASALAMRKNHQSAYYGLGFYVACAIVAVWWPLTMALVITLSWIFWLALALRIGGESTRDAT